jgi:hypothetical protein
MTDLVKLFLVCVVAAFSAGLAAESPDLEVGQSPAGKGVDFSGFWELDYSDSDNIQTEVDIMVRELQRRAQRQSNGNMNSRNGGAVSMGGSGYNSGASIIGLAQMADLITRSQLLEIDQRAHEITIKREETFALGCEFYGKGFQMVETPFGKELCGWDSHQLLFRILLPEGLSIQHRLSLGPAGRRLNIATTVISDRVSYPFTVDRVYNRYSPAATGISCELTLTRGKVCTTETRD